MPAEVKRQKMTVIHHHSKRPTSHFVNDNSPYYPTTEDSDNKEIRKKVLKEVIDYLQKEADIIGLAQRYEKILYEDANTLEKYTDRTSLIDRVQHLLTMDSPSVITNVLFPSILNPTVAHFNEPLLLNDYSSSPLPPLTTSHPRRSRKRVAFVDQTPEHFHAQEDAVMQGKSSGTHNVDKDCQTNSPKTVLRTVGQDDHDQPVEWSPTTPYPDTTVSAGDQNHPIEMDLSEEHPPSSPANENQHYDHLVTSPTSMRTTKRLNSTKEYHQKSDNEKDLVIETKQQRLYQLYHAAKCQNPMGIKCPISKFCRSTKRLWAHIEGCNDSHCRIRHCYSSRSILAHYQKCNKDYCPICVPVRKQINELESNNHFCNTNSLMMMVRAEPTTSSSTFNMNFNNNCQKKRGGDVVADNNSNNDQNNHRHLSVFCQPVTEEEEEVSPIEQNDDNDASSDRKMMHNDKDDSIALPLSVTSSTASIIAGVQAM